MINNDILRRIRYMFDYSDKKVISIFALAGLTVTREDICGWLKKEEEPDFNECPDTQLATFLNGLITERRGKKEGSQPIPESRLNNNIIFRKLKIALDLQAEDILLMLDNAGINISKHELSAFFRKPGHKHYRECKEQVLRNFLKGAQIEYRENKSE